MLSCDSPSTKQQTTDAPRYQSYRETRRARAVFSRVKAVERAYASKLRKIADYIGHFVDAFDPSDPTQIPQIQDGLNRYADMLRPWAKAVASRLLVEIARRDEQAWFEYGKLMGVELRHVIRETDVGSMLRQLLDEQVELITSLPIEAGMRVSRLAVESRISGSRADELAAEINRTSDVTRSRAMLIARTETARAASGLTQARAVAIGSPGYIWRAMGDESTRPAIGTKNFARLNTLAMGSHRKLDGTFHRWDAPPIADPSGVRAHAGCIWNCRCWTEPVLPSKYGG